MELADPSGSYAVLIGSSTFASDKLEDLPAVKNNITALGELLEDSTVWGLPREHCIRVTDPASAAEVLDVIHDTARRTEDTLLIYYAGHGLTHPDIDGLLLTLPSSDPDRPYTTVNFDEIRREILNAGRNVNKVVILDCCYSGQAITGGMSGPVEMAEQARIAGSYLLTASAATRLAQAPPGEPYTAFTGELVQLLNGGTPDGGDVLEVGKIYEHLHTELRAKGRPLPQQRLSNAGRTLAFARNRHSIGLRDRTTTRETSEDRVPERLRAALRNQPRAIIAHATRLREGDDPADTALADELLSLAAQLRPAQEVAALVWLLRGGTRTQDADIVLPAAAGRRAQDIVELVDALHATDNSEDVDHLLGARAGCAGDEVAAVVKALRSAQRVTEAEWLMNAATERLRTTEQILDLAGALWSAEMGADADRVLKAATTSSLEETARLADALLVMGQKEKAFELYRQSAAVVSRRPTADIVRVLQAMDQADHPQAADELLRETVRATTAPPQVQDLCEVLWSMGMESRAQAVLRWSATGLTTADTIALGDSLRAAGHETAVLYLLRQAASLGPIERISEFIDALREAGRPVDGNRLLTDVADRPIADVAELWCWLEQHGRTRDRDRLLNATAARSPGDRAALLQTLHARGHAHDDLLTPIALAPTEELLSSLHMLREHHHHHAAAGLLRHLARTDTTSAAQRLADFEAIPDDGASMEALILRIYLRQGRADDSTLALDQKDKEAIRAHVTGHPLEQRVDAMSALCAAGLDAYVEPALHGDTSLMRTRPMLECLTALHQVSLTGCAHALIRDTARWKTAESFRALIRTLDDADLGAYAEYARTLSKGQEPVPTTEPPPPTRPSAPPSTPLRTSRWNPFRTES
ncbi:caspase family protein [Streptomyces sp. NBC_00989]|uniref:caspase family protein n=1 Tax=Streptomyces sp. NBC_00989 TaxID=2903705 RepID=UPI0038665277|nr:caspase family protein [Streptomyces sp. NBC_00989]